MSRPQPTTYSFDELTEAVSGLRGPGSIYTSAWRKIQRDNARLTRRMRKR